jgi:hypothetical protein
MVSKYEIEAAERLLNPPLIVPIALISDPFSFTPGSKHRTVNIQENECSAIIDFVEQYRKKRLTPKDEFVIHRKRK